MPSPGCCSDAFPHFTHVLDLASYKHIRSDRTLDISPRKDVNNPWLAEWPSSASCDPYSRRFEVLQFPARSTWHHNLIPRGLR